ncbi:adhesin, partial [Haloarcula rubripromontorii]
METNQPCDDRPYSVTRRQALGAGAGALATGFAGCLTGGGREAASTDSGGTDGADGPVAVASFFSFYDFARNIARGTPITVKNLIPTGLH